jgi:hypothetical protein
MAARLLSRISLIVVLLAMLSTAPARSTPILKSQPQVTARGYYPEVRLRKLHLVRPDLIPYPIYFEIYC